MEENNSKKLYYTEISSVTFSNLKNNTFVSKSNDFAICECTNSNIKISLGSWKRSLSTIQKKLKAGEFVVTQNNENKDELYFVFCKKDLAEQPNNDVENVLLLPSDKILVALIRSKPSRREDILQLADSIRQDIKANKNMNLQQKILDLYNGKNNENSNITNENIDLNNNISQENNNQLKTENNKPINENEKLSTNNINSNNNLNHDIPNENKDNTENKNNNEDNKEEKDENENSNSNQNKESNEEDNNEHNNLNDNIDPNNKRKNTVSLFGLGCCSIQSDKRNDHCCGGCFW